MVVCYYWKGSIKYGPDGVYYEGSTPKKIRVRKKTALSTLLNGLYPIFGLDKQKSEFKIFGRYPVVVSPDLFMYLLLPVVNDTSLETMLEVPSNHPSLKNVELYLEVTSTSDDVNDHAACSSVLENPASSSKRQRIQQPQEATGYVSHPFVKVERDNGLEIQGVGNSNGWIEDEEHSDFGNGSTHGGGDGEMTDKNSGSDDVVNLTANNGNALKDLNVPGLEASANPCLLNKGVVDSSASKPWSLSSLWVDDHELRVGLCFKDRDELKKAVDWCSIRGQQKCVVKEIEKDEYMFKCIRWKCNWSLRAARIEEHGLVEITTCSGPHTGCSIKPENFNVEFAAEEIECLIRVQPTLTIVELKNWWFEKFGDMLKTSELRAAKQEVIKKVYGDWDQSFRVLPKLMAAFHSSNGLLVDWQYELFPNPEFASFGGVFWAFPQSIEGFRHCRPLIIVDTKDLNSKYPVKLMIASGLDADDCFFPLAFALTKEVSTDSWHWFLTGIREKVTQRKDVCLISSPHPDIVAVINEPGSLWQEPWVYHRFCLDRFCLKFHDIFQDYNLVSLVKQAGSTSQKEEFDSYMKDIEKKNSEARKWLDQFPQTQWALAHDSGRRYGVMTIETEVLFAICESFQSLGLSVTANALRLFDELRLLFHTGLCDSSGRVNCGDVYTKLVTDKLDEFRTASVTYVVMPIDKGVFQVTEPLHKDGWIVRLRECTCTCGKFQSKKFPCLHVLAVCEKLKINPLQYVDDCYTLERLFKTYTATFSPVPKVSAWPEASGIPTLFPPVMSLPPPPPNLSGK
ncbi:MULE transposase domain [Arabidopsis suecica]|uniref:MULE transposase domain n=1 Tax=Arabidopsis suecica TaxID=45249 RepID=A0A8T2BJR5_ARASU|nr:MULE transposase domain [Arabidopsis suecica]